jgi:hypothetical protein
MARRPIKKDIPGNSLPATTPEGQESRMISYAVNLAEQQLRDGTASAQVITHYLKLATQKSKLEEESIKADLELKKAKTEALQSAKRVEELYSEAIKQMRVYSGTYSEDDEELQ